MADPVSPLLNLDAFNCPHCDAYANQRWGNATSQTDSTSYLKRVDGVRFSLCEHCKKYAIWNQRILVYPSMTNAPLPNNDIPDDIKGDYQEARQILSLSPRGASALMRLCIQKLTDYILSENKEDELNKNIGKLVVMGLPVRVQQALDLVRVIGNNAVHPGTLDIKDDMNTALRLFYLVNHIADYLITKPNEIENLYRDLSPNSRRQIEKRDKQT